MRIRHFSPGLWARGVTALLVVAVVTTPRPLLADCDGQCSPSFTNWNFPQVMVGSPSGQARPFSASVSINSGTRSATIQEFWIGYSDEFVCGGHSPVPYNVRGGNLACFEPKCFDLTWPYQWLAGSGTTSASGTFYPRFGESTGSAAVCVQILSYCSTGLSPGYFYNTVPACVIARSTDVDDDGDTDQNDKVIVGRDLRNRTTRHLSFNLNTDLAADTVVDISDYMVIVNEMQRAQPDTVFTCSGDLSSEDPTVALVPDHVADTSAPGATTLSISNHTGYSFTFNWTAPGDDTDDPAHGNQQIGAAEEYDLRWSCAPITSANFANATRVTSGIPSPALAGTSQSATLTVDAGARYWAIRTQDHFGNWSAVGPCLQIFPAQTISDFSICSTSKNCMLVGWTAPEPGTSQIYDLRYSQAPITDECSFASATPTGPPASQSGFISTYIYSLTAGRDYYAAVRSRTSSTEPWSAISNIGATHTPTTGLSCRTDVLCSGDGFAAKPAVDENPATLEFVAPTPANGQTANELIYAIPTRLAGQVLRLEVFDVTGRRMAEVVNGISAAGSFSARWDHGATSGARVRAGLYYARLRVGGEQLQRTIVVTQ